MNILTAPQTKTENAVRIVVTEAIGDTICIASEDGQKVYDRIAAAFHAGKNAIGSFKDAEDITTAFLAEAIGQFSGSWIGQKLMPSTWKMQYTEQRNISNIRSDT